MLWGAAAAGDRSDIACSWDGERQGFSIDDWRVCWGCDKVELLLCGLQWSTIKTPSFLGRRGKDVGVDVLAVEFVYEGIGGESTFVGFGLHVLAGGILMNRDCC